MHTCQEDGNHLINAKTVQNDFPAVQKDVDAWLKGLDY